MTVATILPIYRRARREPAATYIFDPIPPERSGPNAQHGPCVAYAIHRDDGWHVVDLRLGGGIRVKAGIFDNRDQAEAKLTELTGVVVAP